MAVLGKAYFMVQMEKGTKIFPRSSKDRHSRALYIWNTLEDKYSIVWRETINVHAAKYEECFRQRQAPELPTFFDNLMVMNLG